ncbi:MAG: PfkB family carbohydrate kinase [Clostridium sp.]|nr:PfkB family carbohydrate kinase [Clostridium sp.]
MWISDAGDPAGREFDTMIVTVTMNPAIDKTVDLQALLPGGLNRIQRVAYDIGGKGINVSKTIHALGGESIATGFFAGNTGKTMEQGLKGLGIETKPPSGELVDSLKEQVVIERINRQIFD